MAWIRRRSTRVRLGGGAAAVLLLAGLTLAVGGGGSEETEEGSENAGTEEAATPAPTDPQPLEYANWETMPPGEHAAYNQRANLIQRGRRVYLKYCVGCHGERGDGTGPAAERLITKPRDFTSGIYKFRSTDSSSLPLESDLYRTITRGLARVSMPAFPFVPETEKVAVIEYIKSFYPRWEQEKDERVVVPVPRAPADLGDRERVLRGRVVYVEMQCSQCHGIDGQGTGATQTEYVDAWNNPQRPFNFTRGSLKGGNAPEDIYRTFHTGLRSIMPAYEGDTLALAAESSFRSARDRLDTAEYEELLGVIDQFPDTADEVFEMEQHERDALALRNSWDLVAYILSLRTTVDTSAAVLGPLARGETSSHE
jgi:cytochrome c oxidase cbb3-type subunit 2